jgi:hypothetical protein
MRQGLLAAAALLALGVMTTPANAAKIETTLKIDASVCVPEGCTIIGHVSSPKGKCERRRRVDVFHDAAFWAKDRSNHEGTFSAHRDDLTELESGTYSAFTKKRRLESGDVCKAATSPPLNVT